MVHKSRWWVPGLALLSSVPFLIAGSAAQDWGPAQVAAEFVVGHCFRSIDDITRVKSMARILKWQPLSPEMANAMKPVDSNGYEAWQMKHQGQIFLAAVNTGAIDGKRTEVCTMIANHPPEVIIPLVLKSIKARFLRREEAAFQIEETYELDHPTLRKAMLTVIRGLDKEPPVNFSFIGFR